MGNDRARRLVSAWMGVATALAVAVAVAPAASAQDDIFVIEKGLGVTDRIVLEGVRQVRDGEKVEYAFRKPEEALANQKQHAE